MKVPEITPEQREAAWQAIRKWTAAIGSGPQDPDYALDALIAEGWGPVADAEARGYWAGIEAAARECRLAAAEVLQGQVRPGQPRRVVTRPMARMAIRCAQRIRALAAAQETPHG